MTFPVTNRGVFPGTGRAFSYNWSVFFLELFARFPEFVRFPGTVWEFSWSCSDAFLELFGRVSGIDRACN